ncbi:ATP-grasp domain-containing protein [Chryseobacterium phocaeense]|uniref:hypothetical protein n=1 Tax=Chryseobacterium phocaeense TaxID=1816690 RepID=UPI0009BA29C0|nr:hypothetical protein [Chryseobacterium phocaeense]
MILILGSHHYEQGTDPVIDWLIYYKVPFLKITLNDLFYAENGLSVNIGKRQIFYRGINLNEEVNVVWYRHFMEAYTPLLEEKDPISTRMNKETHNEISCFMEMFQEYLKDKKWFSGMDAVYLNKLTALNAAEEAGFKIPYSAILTSRREVLRLLEEQKLEKLIMKPFSDRSKSYYTIGERSYVTFVQEFSKKDAESLQDRFFPALFQEKIETDFEIRVFYLNGNCTSTAILIDGGYDTDDRKKITDSNRISVVQYALPKTVEEQLVYLMKTLNLMMGSVDLIRTLRGDFVFLEINPIGQYSYESEKNNFYTEKKIAECLMHYNKFTKS